MVYDHTDRLRSYELVAKAPFPTPSSPRTFAEPTSSSGVA
jgi:hypothetical protein